ncbi:phage portal protein [Phenylobacterium sp.]|uniref:phage portal protein n=1 Tax=Phenylobacterium sp. TaxID=1871053 RepID=UPI0027359F20|nr:phage portal protein [Phenylobacterium sp.]MDP3853627.1 phage portal protein [Phenylobacterium sp.]
MRFSIGLDLSRGEPRSSLENPAMSLSDPAAWQSLLDGWNSSAGPAITVESALGVPAFWCGVNFLSGMLASLPVHEFKRTGAGRERVTEGGVSELLSGAVNDDLLTSFKWRKGLMISALTTGAGRAYVEKNKAGKALNIFPLETKKTKKVRASGRIVYQYRDGSAKPEIYAAGEVIDITWLPKPDGLSHYDPIKRMRDTIGLAIALEQYGAKFFRNGGVPPLALHAPAGSPGAMARARTDTDAAVRKANEGGSNVVFMPNGTELKPIGIDPEKSQLIEGQRFVIEQFARFLGLPPIFLQDLTHGTFTNSEQQDLHVVKHVAGTWVQDLDQEFNAKFYGRARKELYVEHNLDGLLRGDFKTRMEGWARGVQGGVVTPNEARRAENRPDKAGGDRLYIQGATVPLEDAGKALLKLPAPTADPEKESDDAQV